MTLPDLNSRIYTLKDSVLSFELSGLSINYEMNTTRHLSKCNCHSPTTNTHTTQTKNYMIQPKMTEIWPFEGFEPLVA